MRGTQIDNFPIENISTAKNFSMPTLIEEMNTVLLVKYEFEYPVKIKMFSLEVSEYQDTDGREKNNDFFS